VTEDNRKHAAEGSLGFEACHEQNHHPAIGMSQSGAPRRNGDGTRGSEFLLEAEQIPFDQLAFGPVGYHERLLANHPTQHGRGLDLAGRRPVLFLETHPVASKLRFERKCLEPVTENVTDAPSTCHRCAFADDRRERGRLSEFAFDGADRRYPKHAPRV
jgi:hypothetical protein